jgi:hypothetical protein
VGLVEGSAAVIGGTVGPALAAAIDPSAGPPLDMGARCGLRRHGTAGRNGRWHRAGRRPQGSRDLSGRRGAGRRRQWVRQAPNRPASRQCLHLGRATTCARSTGRGSARRSIPRGAGRHRCSWDRSGNDQAATRPCPPALRTAGRTERALLHGLGSVESPGSRTRGGAFCETAGARSKEADISGGTRWPLPKRARDIASSKPL